MITLRGNNNTGVSNGGGTTARIIPASLPTKLEYVEGEALDTSGLTLNFEEVGSEPSSISTFYTMPNNGTNLTRHNESIQVDYKNDGKIYSLNIPIKVKYPVRLRVNYLPKSSYKKTEVITIAGINISLIYNDGSEKILEDISNLTTTPAIGEVFNGGRVLKIHYNKDGVSLTTSYELNKNIEIIGAVDPTIVTFASGSWENIESMLDRHKSGEIDIGDYWKVGDTRKIYNTDGISTSGLKDTLIILDFNGTTNGGTRYNVAIGFKNLKPMDALSLNYDLHSYFFRTIFFNPLNGKTSKKVRRDIGYNEERFIKIFINECKSTYNSEFPQNNYFPNLIEKENVKILNGNNASVINLGDSYISSIWGGKLSQKLAIPISIKVNSIKMNMYYDRTTSNLKEKCETFITNEYYQNYSATIGSYVDYSISKGTFFFFKKIKYDILSTDKNIVHGSKLQYLSKDNLVGNNAFDYFKINSNKSLGEKYSLIDVSNINAKYEYPIQYRDGFNNGIYTGNNLWSPIDEDYYKPLDWFEYWEKGNNLVYEGYSVSEMYERNRFLNANKDIDLTGVKFTHSTTKQVRRSYGGDDEYDTVFDKLVQKNALPSTNISASILNNTNNIIQKYSEHLTVNEEGIIENENVVYDTLKSSKPSLKSIVYFCI